MKIKKQVDLKDLIFEKVSQEQIFRYYYPYDFKLNQLCLSPFVKERNPSMVIGTKSKDGDIIFKCFNSPHKGDCIIFVREMFSLDYREALIKIAQDFGLLEQDNIRYESIIKELPISKITKKKNAPDIVVATRSFTSEELKYWSDYYQDIEDLKRENIFVPKKIWINKVPLVLKSTELTFCYYYPEIDKWKIYKPFMSKDKKWFTNVAFDFIENINNVSNCKKVFISKAKKDAMILRKAIGTNCIVTTQAEDLACFNKQSIDILKQIEKVYTCFDADEKGKASSWLLTQNFGFKHCNVQDKYLKEGITDFSDLAKAKSIEYVYNHFKRKNLI